LAQAGRGSSDTLCGTASFGSRPSLCDTPACRQAAATLEASGRLQRYNATRK